MILLMCVDTSTSGDFYTFLRSLESIIQKVKTRKKQLILCGDWNINFMQKKYKTTRITDIIVVIEFDKNRKIPN